MLIFQTSVLRRIAMSRVPSAIASAVVETAAVKRFAALKTSSWSSSSVMSWLMPGTGMLRKVDSTVSQPALSPAHKRSAPAAEIRFIGPVYCAFGSVIRFADDTKQDVRDRVAGGRACGSDEPPGCSSRDPSGAHGPRPTSVEEAVRGEQGGALARREGEGGAGLPGDRQGRLHVRRPGGEGVLLKGGKPSGYYNSVAGPTACRPACRRSGTRCSS